MRDSKRNDFKGIYNQPIVVVDENLETLAQIKRNLQFGDFGAGVYVRFKNKRYQVQQLDGMHTIIVRSTDSARHSFKQSQRGCMSAACKGARY